MRYQLVAPDASLAREFKQAKTGLWLGRGLLVSSMF